MTNRERAESIAVQSRREIVSCVDLRDMIERALDEKAAESDKWKSLAGEFVEAAAGLSHGEDWNNGTHAKLHGYRQKLLDVLAKAREAGL